MLLEQFNWKFRLFIILICLNFIYIIYFTYASRCVACPKQQLWSKSRVFIFTSDNRPIVNGQNEFYTLSALINFVYARRYKYTFRYFHVTYNDTRKIAKNVPFKPSCFNQVLNQERSVHWAKLQVIWHVLETYSSTHDLFLYLDSDAVVNDHNSSLSILLSNLTWVTPSKCKDFGIKSCHMAFVFDPWNKNESFVVPNSGVLLFQSTFQFRNFIRLWWHLNMHESNFFGFYEQDSLWNLLEDVPSPAARSPSADVLANRQVWNTKIKDILRKQNLKTHVGILDLKTFGNTNQSQFFVHMTSGLRPDHRRPELLSIWQRIQKTSNQTQPSIEIAKQFVVQFDATNDRIPWN